MKLTKRFLAMFMAMLMAFSCMAVTASADEGATVKLVDSAIDMEARTLTLNKLVDNASGWNVSFTTSPSSNAAPTLITETDKAFFYANLIAGTTYTITVVAVVNNLPMTQIITHKLLKSQNAPVSPVPKKITTSSIEVNVVAGCEYRLQGAKEFTKNTTFSNLLPGTYYTIEMRYAETATHYASPVSSTAVRTLDLAPAGVPNLPAIEEFLVDKTNNSITVKELPDVEYSIDGGKNWQVSGHFTKLNPDTTYAVIARFRFDPTVQAPNPSCAPIEIRTNKRASYPADLKNCKLTASDGEKYANQSVSIAVTADTPADFHDTQFGDTKYVPQYYTIDDNPTKYYFTSSDGRVFKSSFIPGDEKANKKISINVFFNKMKCVGEKPDGEASWIVDGKEESKTYYVQVGESYTIFTKIRDFFNKIFGVLFNDIPAKINDLIKGINLDDIMAGFGALGNLLNGLGGLTGGVTGGTEGGLGDLLGGLTPQQ